MDATIKAKWVEALRSGEYKQGCIHLRYNERYCCLGVLCVAALDHPLNADPMEDPPATDAAYVLFEPVLGGEAHIATLTNMNDCQGKSFAEIADYIEQKL